MKGNVLQINEDSLLLRGDDQKKYKCVIAELKSEVKPLVGDPVDFDVDGDLAIEVYILRANTKLDNLLTSVKSGSEAAMSQVKSHLTEENAQKIKQMTESAGLKAKELFAKSTEGLKSSTAGEKAKALLGGSSDAVESADSPTDLKASISKNLIKQRFRVFCMLFLMVAAYMPLFEVWGQSGNFFDVVESNFLLFMCIGGILSLTFKLNINVYRVFAVLALFAVIYPFYDLYSEFSEVSKSMSGMGLGNVMGSVMDEIMPMVGIGAYALVAAVIATILSLLAKSKKSVAQTEPVESAGENW